MKAVVLSSTRAMAPRWAVTENDPPLGPGATCSTSASRASGRNTSAYRPLMNERWPPAKTRSCAVWTSR